MGPTVGAGAYRPRTEIRKASDAERELCDEWGVFERDWGQSGLARHP